jgi:hypothetical protein
MGSNYTRNVNDTYSVELEGGEFRDELLTFGGAGTTVKGTLLARQLAATAITPSAVTGTGNGTVTAASVIAGGEVPKVGNWTLKCVVAVTNGGTFSLTDPDGLIRGTVTLTAGAGGATAFKEAGIGFTINDGSTDFVVGDSFTLPIVTGSNKLVPFALAGAGGAQRPVAVLTYDVTAAGAGDIPVRALVAGKVNKKRLVIALDGNDTNITADVVDKLRAVSIIPLDVQQISQLDN